MEIEKTLLLPAAPARVWALLLDPVAMGACVPGMESIEVVSDDEYVAVMKVKISFISARFKLRTRIAERDAPRYLRAEGTGEDASVASSLKQVSEMWLDEHEGGGTALRMKVQVDVLGRMGTFGLSVMKTKADRLWDEFGVNAAARLRADEEGAPAQAGAPAGAPASSAACAAGPAAATAQAPDAASPAAGVAAPAAPSASGPALAIDMPPARAPGWWSRLFARGDDIHVEVRRGDTLIRVRWPAHAAPECAAWLRELMRS